MTEVSVNSDEMLMLVYSSRQLIKVYCTVHPDLLFGSVILSVVDTGHENIVYFATY